MKFICTTKLTRENFRLRGALFHLLLSRKTEKMSRIAYIASSGGLLGKQGRSVRSGPNLRCFRGQGDRELQYLAQRMGKRIIARDQNQYFKKDSPPGRPIGKPQKSFF